MLKIIWVAHWWEMKTKLYENEYEEENEIKRISQLSPILCFLINKDSSISFDVSLLLFCCCYIGSEESDITCWVLEENKKKSWIIDFSKCIKLRWKNDEKWRESELSLIRRDDGKTERVKSQTKENEFIDLGILFKLFKN